MRKFKIGLVLDDTLDTPDGVQQYVLILGNWLSRQGHDVHYLVGATERKDISNVHPLSRNIHVRFNGNGMSTPLPSNKRRLRTFLESEAFDVLHVQMPYSPFLAHRIINAAPKKTAIIGTFHVVPESSSVRTANRILAAVTRSSLRRFDKIFATSTASQYVVEHIYNCKSDVLPCVIEADKFYGASPLPQYNDGTFTIMFLGRLVPRKGAKIVLEAATILHQRNNLPNFRVVICGKGPLSDELRRYVAEQSLGKFVSFTGFVPEKDKPRYIASADVMAYPSSGGESFGVVLIEAMAAGSVVLAGANEGYKAVLAEKTELLFPADQPFELANKITAYMRDNALRKEALAWEKKYVRQFDVAVVGKKLEQAYDEVLQAKS